MTHAKRLPARRSGAASVEFAFLAPILLTVLLGIWEVGRMVQVQQILSNAAREAGRQASTSNLTNTQVIQVVKDYMNRAGLPAAAANNATITVTNLTSGTDATAATQLDHFQISLSVIYNDVRWVNLNLIASSSTDPTTATRLGATADWYSMNDVPITVSTAIPPS